MPPIERLKELCRSHPELTGVVFAIVLYGGKAAETASGGSGTVGP